MHHKFDKAIFDECDLKARTWAKQLFKRYNVELKDNSDDYGVDLIAYRNNVAVGYVEVEIKKSWGDLFMYRHLNVPVRKKKLLTASLPSVLVTFNNDGTKCFICKDDVVLNSEIEEVKNKHISQGEMFYKVPIDKIKLVTM
jgi:hypothetical protein